MDTGEAGAKIPMNVLVLPIDRRKPSLTLRLLNWLRYGPWKPKPAPRRPRKRRPLRVRRARGGKP